MVKTLTDAQINCYTSQGYLRAEGVIPSIALNLARSVLEQWVDRSVMCLDGDNNVYACDTGHRAVMRMSIQS